MDRKKKAKQIIELLEAQKAKAAVAGDDYMKSLAVVGIELFKGDL